MPQPKVSDRKSTSKRKTSTCDIKLFPLLLPTPKFIPIHTTGESLVVRSNDFNTRNQTGLPTPNTNNIDQFHQESYSQIAESNTELSTQLSCQTNSESDDYFNDYIDDESIYTPKFKMKRFLDFDYNEETQSIASELLFDDNIPFS